MYYTSGAPCVRYILPAKNTSRYNNSIIIWAYFGMIQVLIIIWFYYYNNLQKRPAQIIIRKRPA
jgi:hypothetical protein